MLASPCVANVLAAKVVRQRFQASTDLLQLLDEFRRTVNVCIGVGVAENVSRPEDSLDEIIPGEAMVEEREPENETLILKVDGGKLSQQPPLATIDPTKT